MNQRNSGNGWSNGASASANGNTDINANTNVNANAGDTKARSASAAKAISGRVQTGRNGEEAAADMLLANGYFIRHRNWRCRSGELDIIAEKDGRLVIIEVRTRRAGGRFGTAAESVDYRKRRQLQTTAQVYMQSAGVQGCEVRFDVIAVSVNSGGKLAAMEHYEGAF
ncbi:endonuclease [Paenibacillus darwinianus]|uniref:UPF0102 protein BG53_11555 n=1 Tax=Paenibacillus darwinianus TaxID=1380763 RepID=A0A9W5S388_9BACL|nr:YraN family protein [Paenibacillus darwinianus]EXX91369.1 endonuclease [Paenibacillus darwinianus]EXX92344.1 endonuclease [Paenibacillus darwinianus]EXX92848.1 endonuclease [Paenibacillus darwinianus]